MRDLDKRLGRLEGLLGDCRCKCERNVQGVRFFVSTSPAEVEEAQARFDSCRAAHAADDVPLVVLINLFSDGTGPTGVAPMRTPMRKAP